MDEAKVERGKSCLENHTTEIAGNRQQFLTDADEDDALKIRGHVRTGRAMESDTFFDLLESALERAVKPKKSGCKKKIDGLIGMVSLYFPNWDC